ncbi:MAG TPA: hypothetical protein VH817_12250 [Thermoleophilaceae bacterium]
MSGADAREASLLPHRSCPEELLPGGVPGGGELLVEHIRARLWLAAFRLGFVQPAARRVSHILCDAHI